MSSETHCYLVTKFFDAEKIVRDCGLTLDLYKGETFRVMTPESSEVLFSTPDVHLLLARCVSMGAGFRWRDMMLQQTPDP